MKPTFVRMQMYKGKAGLFYATSPDLKGLLVAEKTLESLMDAIPRSINDLYAAIAIMSSPLFEAAE